MTVKTILKHKVEGALLSASFFIARSTNPVLSENHEGVTISKQLEQEMQFWRTYVSHAAVRRVGSVFRTGLRVRSAILPVFGAVVSRTSFAFTEEER